MNQLEEPQEDPIVALRRRKDATAAFIAANAVDAIFSQPKTPEEAFEAMRAMDLAHQQHVEYLGRPEEPDAIYLHELGKLKLLQVLATPPSSDGKPSKLDMNVLNELAEQARSKGLMKSTLEELLNPEQARQRLTLASTAISALLRGPLVDNIVK